MNPSFFHCPSIGFPAEGVVQTEGVPSSFNSRIKGMCVVFLSQDWIASVPSMSELQFVPDVVKLTTTESHHTQLPFATGGQAEAWLLSASLAFTLYKEWLSLKKKE